MAEFELGLLSSGNTRSFANFVGNTDVEDTYRFLINGVSAAAPINFNASLTGMSQDADIYLFRDVNNNGVIDAVDGGAIASSVRGSNADDSINTLLNTSGAYIARVVRFSTSNTSYTLRLSNVGSRFNPSNLLPIEVNAGTLNIGATPFLSSDSVSTSDTADVYRFTMGGVGNFNASLRGITPGSNVNMRLIRDTNNNGIVDGGEEIVRAARLNDANEAINVRNLAAGNYFLQTYLFSGTTGNYTLRMSNTGPSGSSPSNLLPIETNAGTLGATPFSIGTALSTNNASDNYRFTMGSAGNFNASLRGISSGADVDMRLIRDANNNGVVDAGEEIVRATAAGNADDSISVRNLAAGTYFLQTYLFSGSLGSHTLRMSNTGPSGSSPSNLLPIEINAGTLGATPFSIGAVLNTVNASDNYRFTMGSAGNFNASLTGISSGADVDMRLIRDANNNGIVDGGEEIVRAAAGSNADDAINVRNLAAGNYILQTYLFSGSSGSHTLRMSNTGSSGFSPSNLLPTETNVGTLTGSTSRVGSVSVNDAADTFQFSISSNRTVNLSLTGLSADADLRLIRDTNNNRIVDAGEVIASSTAGGTSPENISQFLTAGNYLAQVYLFPTTGNTSYTIGFS